MITHNNRVIFGTNKARFDSDIFSSSKELLTMKSTIKSAIIIKETKIQPAVIASVD